MTTLLEDPTYLIAFGIVAEAVLGFILANTGRGVVLVAMVGVLLLVTAGVAVEWLVVTEVERVEAVIDGVAAALEDNDRRVLDYIAPSDDYSRRRAIWALREVEFTEIKIRDLKIKINELSSPPTATANFIGVVSGRDRTGDFGHLTRPVGFTLEFCLQSGRWLITGHRLHYDPRDLYRQ